MVDFSRMSLLVLNCIFRQYDPVLFQDEIGKPFLSKYYSSVDSEDKYKIDNVEIRVIVWGEDVYKDQVLVEMLAISQIKQMNTNSN